VQNEQHENNKMGAESGTKSRMISSSPNHVDLAGLVERDEKGRAEGEQNEQQNVSRIRTE